MARQPFENQEVGVSGVVYKQRTMEIARSFVQSIVNDCKGCLRRSNENCRSCFARTAHVILREMESDEKHMPIDYSLYARCNRIREILEKAGRPLMSRDIDLNGVCSFQLKLWTINHMVKVGILGKKMQKNPYGRSKYLYFLKIRNKNKETKNENNIVGNR